jgi:hypothetical protein
MPRDGAVVLSDLRNRTLSIVCEPCGRRGSYGVAPLMEQHGDAKLTDLLQTLANCPKAALGQYPRSVQGGVRRAGHIVQSDEESPGTSAHTRSTSRQIASTAARAES